MNSLLLLLAASQIFTLSYSQSIDTQLPAFAAAAKAPKAGKGKAPKASFLTFDPPLLQLQKFKTDEVPVGISLKKAPRRAVSIYIEAPGMIFSECRLKFTPDNWNKKQVIKASPMPYLAAAAKARKVQAKFCYSDKGDSELHKSCQNYPIQRKAGKGCRCSVQGDPHYTSFVRQKFDFQGNGAYYLVKSKALDVQQVNRPWSAGTTVQKRVALRYYDTVYVFNGATKNVQRTSKAKGGVRIAEVPGVGWRAAMSDGSRVTVTYTGSGDKFYLGTDVILGQNYDENVDGLCGKMGKGASVKSAAALKPAQLNQKWKVPQEDNLFKLGPKATSVVEASLKKADLVIKNQCKVPDLDQDTSDGTDNYEQNEAEVKTLETFRPIEDDNKGTEGVTPNTAKAPTKAWLNAAKTKCTTLLTIKSVNAVLNPRAHIGQCVQDCLLSKSYDFIEGSKRAYLLAVQDYVKSTKAEPIFNGQSPAAKKLNTAVIQACDAAGLGATKCPGGCSDNGVCTSSGCACKVGYTGIDCSREVPQAPPGDKSYTDEPAPLEEAEELPEPEICTDVNKAAEEEPEEENEEEETN